MSGIWAIKDNVQSFSDIRNPWAQNVGKIVVPVALERFIIFSSNIQLANTLLSDERFLTGFVEFKQNDSRGHAVMPFLEFQEGVLILKFHSSGGLQPNLFNFYNNVSSIEGYLEKMIVVAARLE